MRLLRELGYDVVVEPGAGSAATFPDDAYADAGAQLGDPLAADVVLGVNALATEQRTRLRAGTTVVDILAPATDTLVGELASTARCPPTRSPACWPRRGPW